VVLRVRVMVRVLRFSSPLPWGKNGFPIFAFFFKIAAPQSSYCTGQAIPNEEKLFIVRS
jgi:hypothetical protein